jgi:hypothetical protein
MIRLFVLCQPPARPSDARASEVPGGGGSIGLLGAARAVFLAAPHPGDAGCNVLVPVKTNLTATPPSIAYRVVAASTVARIEWLDEVACRAEDILTARHQTNDRALVEAMDFLRNALASGERPATDVLWEANETGIADITFRRARKEVGVRVRREGFGKGSRLLLSLEETPDVSGEPEA